MFPMVVSLSLDFRSWHVATRFDMKCVGKCRQIENGFFNRCDRKLGIVANRTFAIPCPACWPALGRLEAGLSRPVTA